MIHLYFEQDLIPGIEGEIEAKDAVRKELYLLLYETEYSYGRKTTSETSTFGSYEEPPPMPDLPPENMPTKPYFPPTSQDDFAAAGLDAPLG